MAIMEGTRSYKTWTGDYSFAVDGGAQGTLVLRSNDGPIPNGSYIIGGVLDVSTQLNSGGSATAALTVESANDLVTATAYGSQPWASAAQKDIVPDATGSTAIQLTASRNPSLVIATADLTGGVFKLVLFYK